jgi:hypothetical protein
MLTRLLKLLTRRFDRAAEHELAALCRRYHDAGGRHLDGKATLDDLLAARDAYTAAIRRGTAVARPPDRRATRPEPVARAQEQPA